MNTRNILSVFILTLTLCSFSIGQPQLANSQPLSSILKSVEAQKIGIIANAELDEGLWEVKVCNSGECQKLYIDPISGMEKFRKGTDREELPPADALLISTIIESLESKGTKDIKEVEFEDGLWEVKFRKSANKPKLYIDPLSGEEKASY